MAPVPSNSEVRDALDRIRASERFSRADQLTRFLEFTIEAKLNGRADEIKESVLGVEVFGRGTNFDPRIDPIVRVTARKLRDKLQQYYANEGVADRLIIEFPKGGYVPAFRAEPKQAAMEKARPRRDNRRAWLAASITVLLATGAVAGWRATRTPATPVTVAVLAFADLSEAHDQQYFCDGLADDLIDSLAHLPGLRVVARTSSFQFGRTPADVREVGRRLGAQALVEGSVRQSGGRVKVTAQVIETKAGQHLWSGSFERGIGDALNIQEEIARTIAHELPGSLGLPAVAKPGTSNPDAYQANLRGRFFSVQARPAKALEEYQRAVTLDPQYGAAHGGVAYMLLQFRYAGGVDPQETLRKARAEAELAVRLDPSSLEAQRSMAGVLESEMNWKQADEAYRRLLRTHPGVVRAHDVYGKFLSRIGQPEQAVSELRQAVQLDPLNPLPRASLARGLYLVRRHREAIQEANAGLELRQLEAEMLAPLSLAHGALGHHREAIDAARRCVEIQERSSNALGLLGHAYAAAGQRAEALDILHELERRAEQQTVQPSIFARIHLGLGDRERALSYLEQAAAERDPWLMFHYRDQRFDPLRADVRFVTLYRKLGLPYQAY
jgi:TolB-like protein/Flp pilus assembly protein TadD